MNDDETTPAPQRVEKPGVVLVHENDVIFAAEGSTAQLSSLAAAVVTYSFPVEIEIVGGGGEALLEQLCEELRMHFESLV